MEAGWGDPINVKGTCRLMSRAHIRAQVLKGKALRVWVLLRSSHVMNAALLIVQGHGRVTRVVNPFSVKRCLTMLMMLTRPVTTFDLRKYASVLVTLVPGSLAQKCRYRCRRCQGSHSRRAADAAHLLQKKRALIHGGTSEILHHHGGLKWHRINTWSICGILIPCVRASSRC